MSRHRNVKHLIDEDYDDYYDDYYDEDDYTPAAPKAAAASNKTKSHHKPPTTALKSTAKAPVTSGTPKKQQQQQQQQQQPSTKQQQKQQQKHPKDLPKTIPNSSFSSKESSSLPHNNKVSDAKTEAIQTTPKSQNGNGSCDNSNNTSQPPLPPFFEMAASKNSKIPLTIVVLGHVDAGKSTIAGRLVMGKQRQSRNRRNREKNGDNKFDYAWVLDEEETERAHGNTMEVGVKSLDESLFENFRIVLQDAPGHADYVPAAITGMAAADAAVLVVDATADSDSASGGSGGGQLREHVLLAKALGIQQIIVVFNKMDLVGWNNESAYRSKESRLVAFLTGKNVGFHPNHVRCVPASGTSGTNICDVADDNDGTRVLRSWYNGPTLVQALDQLESPLIQQKKLLLMPFRMIVTDVQAESGNTVAIRAKVAQGWVQQGEKLVLVNVGDEVTLAKISSLHCPMGNVNIEMKNLQQKEYCGAGELVDCSLTGIDSAARISTGSVLSRPLNRPALASRCRARILVLGDRLSVPLIKGAHAIFHMHHLDVPCHLSALLRTVQADGSTLNGRPRALSRNCLAMVELKLASPICMEAFKDCRALGRFVLRRSGESIAVGRIEEVYVDYGDF